MVNRFYAVDQFAGILFKILKFIQISWVFSTLFSFWLDPSKFLGVRVYDYDQTIPNFRHNFAQFFPKKFG